jgi:plasmid stabilization system protein ParE
MHHLMMSPAAEQDVLSALEYTRIFWGDAQAERYGQTIMEGLKILQHMPKSGRLRPDLSPKHRSYPIAHHIALYFVEQNTIFLSRFVHQARDISSEIVDDG